MKQIINETELNTLFSSSKEFFFGSSRCALSNDGKYFIKFFTGKEADLYKNPYYKSENNFSNFLYNEYSSVATREYKCYNILLEIYLINKIIITTYLYKNTTLNYEALILPYINKKYNLFENLNLSETNIEYLYAFIMIDFFLANPDRHEDNIIIDMNDNLGIIDFGHAFCYKTDIDYIKMTYFSYLIRLEQKIPNICQYNTLFNNILLFYFNKNNFYHFYYMIKHKLPNEISINLFNRIFLFTKLYNNKINTMSEIINIFETILKIELSKQ